MYLDDANKTEGLQDFGGVEEGNDDAMEVDLEGRGSSSTSGRRTKEKTLDQSQYGDHYEGDQARSGSSPVEHSHR